MLRLLAVIALLVAFGVWAVATGHDDGLWKVLTGQTSCVLPAEPPHAPSHRELRTFAPQGP